jgi:hypothetical protein
MVLVSRITPEKLLSCPRRGPAVPNHDGSLAVYVQSTYHLDPARTQQEICILNVQTGDSYCLFEDENACDPQWLGNGTNTIVYLGAERDGTTWMLGVDAENPGAGSWTIASMPTSSKHMKLKLLRDGSIAVVVLSLDRDDVDGRAGEDHHRHSTRVFDDVDKHIVGNP